MASISVDTFEVGQFNNPMIMKDFSRKRRVRKFYFYPAGKLPMTAVKDLGKGKTVQLPLKMALAMHHAYTAWERTSRKK